jgi:PKD repeat protein
MLGSGLLIAAAPAPASAVMANQSAVVNAKPAAYTPDVNDGTIYAIGQSGSTVFIGGSFTSVSPHGSSTTYADNNIAAFTAGTGNLVTSFAPAINGEVDAIAPGPTSNTVYVGGKFTTVNGVKTKLALLDATTGALVPGWKAPAFNGAVAAVTTSGGQLYVGGIFSTANGVARGGLATLNPTTGALTNNSLVSLTGHHNYGRLCNPSTANCASAGIGVKSFDINPAGTRLIAIGNFTTVTDGGVASSRDQIALFDLDSTSVHLDPNWATSAFTAPCSSGAFDSYVRDVGFSPDGSYFAVVATGGSTFNTNSDGTRGSCDTATRWDTAATGANVRPSWTDYTGNDTLLSVAITGTAIYAGGHERWLNNSQGSDNAKEGAVPRPGIVALDPINGMPLAWNPGRNPRGAGAYSLLATADGLYVGSDTDYVGNYLYHHKKIDFFPLAGGEHLASNAAGSVPGNVYLLGSGTSASTARMTHWDGTTSAPSAPTSLTSVDWSTARGAFQINNQVYYGSTDGHFYQRSFDGTDFGPAVAIDPYDDPYWSNVGTGSKNTTYRGVASNFYAEMSSLTSMFYSQGRVYYTLSGNSHMFYRYFEPDSGVMGADEFTTTDGVNWSHTAGAFLSGSTLYTADSTTKNLLSVPFVNGQASGTPTVANSAIDWTSRGAFVVSGALPPPNQSPTAAFTSSCGGLTCSVNASTSSDPDGSITSYAWTWGDGSSESHTSSSASHTYSGAGNDSVTLTVTDNQGATNSVTKTVAPSSSAPTPISFRAAAATDGNAKALSVKVPASVNSGDELLLFDTYASSALTATVPAGWTEVGTTGTSNLTTTVYSRAATAGDPGSTVSVGFSGTVKASLTLAAYAHAASAVEANASATARTTASHVTPSVSGLVPNSLAVSFWADKSTGTTAWTAPSDVTTRSAVYGTGGGAVSALLGDSGAAVSGAYGGKTATTNATSGSAATWTIGLAPAN